MGFFFFFFRGFKYFLKLLVSYFEIQNIQERAKRTTYTATHSNSPSMFTSVILAPSGHLLLFIVTWTEQTFFTLHAPETRTNCKSKSMSQCIFS